MNQAPVLGIRAARPRDASPIANFNTLLARETEALELDTALIQAGVAALLADEKKGRYFVAEFEGEIVGQIMHTWEWSDWRNGYFWWLQSVYVRQDFRQQGVFRMLYDYVAKLAQDSPTVVGLRLYVDNENQAAQSTYQKLGMTASDYRVMEYLI